MVTGMDVAGSPGLWLLRAQYPALLTTPHLVLPGLPQGHV